MGAAECDDGDMATTADRTSVVGPAQRSGRAAAAGQRLPVERPGGGEPPEAATRNDDTRDEVSHLMAQWRRERPDLDVSPLAVMSRIDRLARHLDRERRGAFAAVGLEPWEFDVLSTLRRAGAGYQLSPGTLLRATLVSSGTMTNRINRLAGRGLVVRERNPVDGRGVQVRLTPKGGAIVDAALADLLRAERRVLHRLGSPEREQLARLLSVLLAPFDRATATPAG